MKFHSFRGKKYRIERKNVKGQWGACENPDIKGKKIVLPTQKYGSKILLETAIHEGLHACFWDLNEDPVNEAARDLSAFLWRLGFRQMEESSDQSN